MPGTAAPSAGVYRHRRLLVWRIAANRHQGGRPGWRSGPVPEIVGAVRGIGPQTGQYFDSTKRYLDALALSDADQGQVFEGNAQRAYPRLDTQLRARLQLCFLLPSGEGVPQERMRGRLGERSPPAT
ncbi:hypothetical protein FHT09_002581 [Xanthomonas arboricola]|nr:hypothetical protein [Xanthomonas sp. CFBP 8152]